MVVSMMMFFVIVSMVMTIYIIMLMVRTYPNVGDGIVGIVDSPYNPAMGIDKYFHECISSAKYQIEINIIIDGIASGFHQMAIVIMIPNHTVYIDRKLVGMIVICVRIVNLRIGI